MERDNLKELHEIRRLSEIERDDFDKVLNYAVKYQQENSITEIELYNLVVETLTYLDNELVSDGVINNEKSILDSFNMALKNTGVKKSRK